VGVWLVFWGGRWGLRAWTDLDRSLINFTSCVDRLNESTWPSSGVFLFFNARTIMIVIFSPSTVLRFWLGSLGWGACTPMISTHPSSSCILLHSTNFIDHISSTYARRNRARIHSRTRIFHSSLTPTHFLEVYILGRSFGSFPVFSSNSFFGFGYFCDLCIFCVYDSVPSPPLHPFFISRNS
jgi:hypothetical protein